MKLTPEQLVLWFYTAFPALTGKDFSAEDVGSAVGKWLQELGAKTGRERSDMISGMRQGINDILAMARDSRQEEMARADHALAQKSLPTIRKMAAALGKKHLRILKRGSIKSDEEFYIVAEILSDVDFEISDADRAKLGHIATRMRLARNKAQQVARANAHRPSFFVHESTVRNSVLALGERGSSLTLGKVPKNPMRSFNRDAKLVGFVRAVAVAMLVLPVSSCANLRIERKADELRRSGVARDMVEARRMAESYYWSEAAQRDHEARRENSEVFPLKRDAKK
jgi:hypothetical protein